MHHRRHLGVASLALGLALGAIACEQKKQSDIVLDQWIGTGRTRILVDGVHQLEGIPDAVWDENEFHYAHSQSTSRLLRNLLEHDFRFRQIKDGEITLDLLRAHDIFYFNVPTAMALGSSKTDRKMPRLRPGEVAAIRRFLEEGGSAFIVGEHNNAYDNIEVLRPLLQPLGVELVDAYASEKGVGRFAMDVGGYIIMARRFDKHFATDGVRMVSWSGGAPFTVASKGGIAFLSETGFIDIGNYVTKKPMEHSNHRVEKGEYQGPNIPIAVALEVGKGRLVAIGDHNMLGTQWLGVGDNYAFGMNAIQWLARREKEAPFRATAPLGVRFGFEQERAGWTIGARNRDGYYSFFYNLSRLPDLFPMGLVDIRDETDILGFLDPQVEYPEEELAAVDRQLAAGKRVFLLVDAASPGAGSVQLLKRYVPNLALRGSSGEVAIRDLAPGPNTYFSRLEGVFGDLTSPVADVRGGKIAALSHDATGFSGKEGGDIRPRSYAKATPYLLDVQLSAGEPLFGAKLPDGRETAIMSRIKAQGGEIVLMIQGKIFSAHTLHCIREEPEETNQPAYDLEMRFMDWIVSRPPLTSAEALAPVAAEPTEAQ